MFARVYTVAILGLLLSGLLLSAGCGSKEVTPVDPEAVKNELIGKVWDCESMFRREISGDVKLTLEFLADGTVRGNGGCNSFTGTYSLAGEALSFGPLASTRKMCGAAAGEQEYSYFTFLAQINKLKVDGDDLELFADEQPSPMVFSTGGGGLW